VEVCHRRNCRSYGRDLRNWFRNLMSPAEWASISEADQWGGACKSFS
jgi:hypothetical protein